MNQLLRVASLALWLAAPASAELKLYPLQGDQSTLLPGLGIQQRPGAVQGLAQIDDTGNGSPTLVDLELTIAFSEVVDGTGLTGVPGTTLFLDDLVTLGPSPGQGGVGSTTTSISWGGLGGWTQQGRLVCVTDCPFQPECPVSGCSVLFDFEGTGPPLPLKATVFSTDPWIFEPDGSAFGPIPAFEISNLDGGLQRQWIRWSGTNVGALPVPAVPAAGLAGLAALLAWRAWRGLRRRRDAAGARAARSALR